MSASLGGLLKDYRLQKNIPQMEIAFALGWKDTSRLSRIEQGIVEKPPRELIDSICAALKLTELEENALLFAGNYLPTKEEIENVRKETEGYIEQFPYPVAIFDFCARNILINKKIAKLLGMNEDGRKQFHREMPTIFELMFDPNIAENKYLRGKELEVWHTNLLRLLIHFKNIQRSILRDKWYLGVLKKLMNIDLFRELWKKSQSAEVNFVTTRYGKKIFVRPDNQRKRLLFNFFMVPLHKDPRFEIEFFTPADAATAEFFQDSN